MIADHFGRRVAMVLRSVVAALAFVSFGLAPGVLVLLVAYAMFALSEALFSGADSAMLFDSLKANHRAAEFTRWNGRLNALVVGSIGLLTIVGSLMTRWVPLAWPMVLSGILTIPSIVLAWRMHEPPREGERESFLATGRGAVRLVLHSVPLWSSSVLMAVTTAAITVMAHIIQPVVVGYGMPVWVVGIFVAVQLLVAALGGWVSDVIGRAVPLRHLFWGAPADSALALVAGTSEVIWLFPVFILPGVGWNVLWPHFAEFVSLRAPDQQRATVISLANFGVGVATVVTLPVVGYGIDRLGLQPVILATSVVLCATAALAYAAWWRAGDHLVAPLAPASGTTTG